MHKSFAHILKKELVPAVGCTEPAAAALAAAAAREHLARPLEHMRILVSRNIFKNGFKVGIPGTPVKGLLVAAALGYLCGDAEAGLEVLKGVEPSCVEQVDALLEKHIISIEVLPEHQGVYVRLEAHDGETDVAVTIDGDHRAVSRIELNGSLVTDRKQQAWEEFRHDVLDDASLQDIFDYASTADSEKLRFVLESATCNAAAAEEGLSGIYGLNAGRLLQSMNADRQGNSLLDITSITRAASMAAAASDARMAGCSFPVVTNSGSGNQGITASLPVYSIARDLKCSEEQLIRALTLSHLIAIYHKHFSDRLSSFCGAASAAVGAGCGVTYLLGGGIKAINDTVNIALSGISGMICDGAKSSCALKIALAVYNALLASSLALSGRHLASGEGIVSSQADDTIRDLGTLTKEGMRKTDEVILKLMLSRNSQNQD